MGFWGPGPFPMDPERNFMQNGGIYMPGTRIWTPFVPKSVKSEISDPMGSPCPPMGIPWGTHGDPMGSPWGPHGIWERGFFHTRRCAGHRFPSTK